MTAKEAMQEVSVVIDAYCEGRVNELRALARIAQITGQYKGVKS